MAIRNIIGEGRTEGWRGANMSRGLRKDTRTEPHRDNVTLLESGREGERKGNRDGR